MDGKTVIYTVLISPENHLIYGAEAIGKIIKKDPREISALVESGGLIAWRDGPKGKWRALCADLLSFNDQEREKQIKGAG